MHAEAEIKFHCGRCGQKLSADVTTAGAVIECPSCTERLTVPTHAWNQHEREPEHLDHDAARLHEQALEAELVTLRAQLAEALSQRTEFERQLAASLGEVQTLTSQLELARESIRDATRRSQSLDKEKTELLAAQEQHVSQIQAFEAAYGELTAQYHQLDAARQQVCETLEERQQELGSKVAELEETRATLSGLQAGLEASKKDLESSKDGREFVRLREETEAANRVRDEAVQAREAADGLIVSLRDEVALLSATLKQTSGSLEEAERKVSKLSDAQLQKDNVVLRSILERQKGEMEQRFRELKKYQRYQFGVRIAYAIVIVAVIALVAYGLQYLPLILKAVGR